jgi:endonuclease III
LRPSGGGALGIETIDEVASRLSARYGDFAHGNKANPLNELVFILCSIKTGELGYQGSYRTLRRRFPTFDALGHATTQEIAVALVPSGLELQKAGYLSAILNRLKVEFGRPTLAPLRMMDDNACERFLLTLPGVGKKTARCVMMYSLGRAVFPVDTHCWRIARRLGWVRRTRPDGSCSSRDMDRLQGKIQPQLRFGMHVNMVSLGRDVCRSRNPRCTDCTLRDFCPRIGVR